MGFRHLMRKAAELVVELPPEAPEQDAVSGSSAPAAALSTDALWADLEKASQKPSASSPSPPPATKTVEQIVRDTPGPNLDEIRMPSPPPQVAAPDGSVNFGAIYQSAHLPTVPFTSEQVLEMLASLPAELPLETKRQMIRVSINAMGKAIGANPENIVSDASRKLAALTSYTESLTSSTQEYVSLSEQKIVQLQAQIEKTRQDITAKQERLQQDTQACTTESHRLDEVLEFFSLDVPPSKHAADPEPQA